MKRLFLLLFLSSMTVAHALEICRVPDSLEWIEHKLADFEKQANYLNNNIITTIDLSDQQGEIDILVEDLNRFCDGHQEINEIDELHDVYIRCRRIVNSIEKKVRKLQEEEMVDSLGRQLGRWNYRFDSVCNIATGMEHRRHGDSVRLVKTKVEGWWSELNMMHYTNESLFKTKPALQSQYDRIRDTREKINDLSEKEAPKPREILTLALAIVAAVAMIIGIVSSRIRAAKLQKKAEESQAFEL